MLKIIMQAIISFLDMSDKEKRNLIDQNCSEQRMIDYIVSFFNCKQDEKLLKKNKHSESNNQKKESMFLVCLDNVEEIISNDRIEFLKYMGELYDSCNRVRIIVTSFRDIGRIPNEINVPKVCFVRQLRSISAVKLFLENCGQLNDEEICEFLFEDENYPFKKFLPCLKNKDENFKVTELTSEIKKDMMILLVSRRVEALAAHDMFKQLSGNPTSISMLAAIHHNPMI